MSSQGPFSGPPAEQRAWGGANTAAGSVGAVDTRAIFAQTMFLVAVTAIFAAAGAYIARDATMGVAMLGYIGAFGIMIGMNVARKSRVGSLGMGLLFGFGLLLGVAIGPTLANYAKSPTGATILWEAAALTGLFIAGFGAAGFATKRDLAPLMRIAFFGLLALIVAGFVMIFVRIPAANMVWSIAGLAIFSVFTMYDFQRIRRAGEDDVVLLSMSIFLDIFNVFLLMLNLLGGGRR
jgi:FtsH-binding integral membrane protein